MYEELGKGKGEKRMERSGRGRNKKKSSDYRQVAWVGTPTNVRRKKMAPKAGEG